LTKFDQPDIRGNPPDYYFNYNGLGDRHQQWVMVVGSVTTTTYTLDLAVGLTQVLIDDHGSASRIDHVYLYGAGCVGEEGDDGWVYHHGDALGSVRMLTKANGAITLSKDYKPFGDVR
jgi:hypothetical protein